MPKIVELDRELLLKAFRAGLTRQQIAEIFDCSTATLCTNYIAKSVYKQVKFEREFEMQEKRTDSIGKYRQTRDALYEVVKTEVEEAKAEKKAKKKARVAELKAIREQK